MKQTPGHGANFIEGLERPIRLGAIDHSSLSEEPQVAVDFLGRRIGNPPVVETISAGSAMAFGEVCWNRAR
jgi:hypothetical protein